MAYESRKPELKSDLIAIQPQISAEELLRLTDAIDRWCTAREEALRDLVGIVIDQSSDCLRIGDFKDRLSRFRDQANSIIGDALNSVREPSGPALTWRTRTLLHETAFIDTWAAVDVGATRDVLVVLTRRLEKYAKDLEEIWKTMTVENLALEDQERIATRQIQEWVDSAVSETTPAALKVAKGATDTVAAIDQVRKDINGYAAHLARKAGLSEETAKTIEAFDPARLLFNKAKALIINDTLRQYADGIADQIRAIDPAIKGKIAERLIAYREIMRRRTDGVFVLFKQTRRDTDKFIETNGLEAGKNRYGRARDDLNRWAADLATEGLKRDGAELAKDLLNAFTRHLGDMETIHDNFVRQNRGRFFGPIGPEFEEVLLHSRTWEDTTGTLAGSSLSVKLAEFRSKANQFLEYDLANCFRSLEYELASADPEFREAMRTYAAAFRDEVMREARRCMEEAAKNFAEAESVVAPEKLKAALDRRVLEDALKS